MSIEFDKTKSIPSLKVLIADEKRKVQNTFTHVLIEKGVILDELNEEKTGYDTLKEVLLDQVYSFSTESELDKFINYIKNY